MFRTHAPIGVTQQNRSSLTRSYLPLSQYFLQKGGGSEKETQGKALYGLSEPSKTKAGKKPRKAKTGKERGKERDEGAFWAVPALPGELKLLDETKRRKGQMKVAQPQKCRWCDEAATTATIHSNAYAYVPTCDKHVGKAKRAVGGEFCYTQPIMQKDATCDLCEKPASFFVYTGSYNSKRHPNGAILKGACKDHLEKIRGQVNNDSSSSKYVEPIVKRLKIGELDEAAKWKKGTYRFVWGDDKEHEALSYSLGVWVIHKIPERGYQGGRLMTVYKRWRIVHGPSGNAIYPSKIHTKKKDATDIVDAFLSRSPEALNAQDYDTARRLARGIRESGLDEGDFLTGVGMDRAVIARAWPRNEVPHKRGVKAIAGAYNLREKESCRYCSSVATKRVSGSNGSFGVCDKHVGMAKGALRKMKGGPGVKVETISSGAVDSSAICLHLGELGEAKAVKYPTTGGWRILGIDDDTDTCEQCGKTGLKRTVVLEPILDGGGIKRVGTTCAEYLTKTRGSWVLRRGVEVQKAKEKVVDDAGRSRVIQGVVKAGMPWKLLQRLFTRYKAKFMKGDYSLTDGQKAGLRHNMDAILKASGLDASEIKIYHRERHTTKEWSALDRFYDIATRKTEERAERCGAVAASMNRKKPTEVQKRKKRHEKAKAAESRAPRTFRDIAMSASKKRKKEKAEASGKVEVNPGVFIDADDGIMDLIRLADEGAAGPSAGMTGSGNISTVAVPLGAGGRDGKKKKKKCEKGSNGLSQGISNLLRRVW